MTMNKIGIDLYAIMPLHEYDDNVKVLMRRALASVPKDMVVGISTTAEIKEKYEREIEEIANEVGTEIAIVGWEGSSDFCTLVNKMADTAHEWFTILEYDDEFTPNWLDNVKKYVEYNPDCSVFLPLEELIDYNTNKFIGYGNEAPWATSFSNEIGYIDNECLQQYFDFYLTGGVFNVKDWRNVGGLKPSIKLTFWYEFLLRLTNNNKKVFVMPKLCYKHYVNRPNSLYDQYGNTISEKESNWWYELSRQEYFFKEDRKKVYEDSVVFNHKGDEE